MSMSSYKVLGSFADIPAVICVDNAKCDSTVSLSFLHTCNVPRIVANHHGVHSWAGARIFALHRLPLLQTEKKFQLPKRDRV